MQTALNTKRALEFFTNRGKSATTKKEKSQRNQKEVAKGAEGKEFQARAPMESQPKSESQTDISLMPQYFPRRPDVYHPTAINPYAQLATQLKEPGRLGGPTPEDMIANCIYYGHMYHSSLMAVKVSLC